MYTSNDILFPHHAILALKNLRGEDWGKLIERVLSLPENHEETLALMLTMIRLNGCMNCETDSFRAMRGCTACAVQSLHRFKEDDDQLFAMYEQALKDVRAFAYQTEKYTILMPSGG
ncbi:MAG: hypothetical protein ACFE0Q_16340 [Anaerolineae bacterium]